jgi:hypothetical protein
MVDVGGDESPAIGCHTSGGGNGVDSFKAAFTGAACGKVQ